MENVYVGIDHVWSYNLINTVKGLFDIDHNVISHIYEQAMTYVRLQHNFIYTHDSNEFNQGYSSIIMELQRYPVPTGLFEHYYKMLYEAHRMTFNSLKGKISTIQPVCNDSGDIAGLIVSVIAVPPCIQSLLKPISQL